MSIRGRDETMSVDSSVYDNEGSSGEEEKMFVSVRMRPLNSREIARNDVCDWECVGDNTIIFKGNMPDRSIPTSYTFDRVFGSECSTKQVYEEGAKDIALAAVSGINSTIFAYGQTSSGKTHTMTGITEYAVKDLYAYMEQHKEREFVLKFSAMEIYNEAVRDLLSSDSTPLRVRDDPEKGVIVDKLIEETLIDWKHLQELISICEAQRQIGETSMNATSSRSHQIMRLTVESSAREYSVAGNSSILIATVNFVDLAGSERNSQTLAAGARLKEGSHINRSLLTLGTVIRKLSTSRNGHIPYRESKLTRILQNSLGGNARTAMICTISPSSYHIEQSRNTLLFASCAKEVTTNAHVNVVMSDKELVKQLRKDLARLETELRSMRSISVTGDAAVLLRQKDLLIEQMDKEIKELTWQRDIANSRCETLLRSIGEERLSRVDDNSVQTQDPEDNSIHENELDNEENEDSCKEVRCMECMNKTTNAGISSSSLEENMATTKASNSDGLQLIHENEVLNHYKSFNSSNTLKGKIQELHETINRLKQFSHNELDGLTMARSNSKKTVVMTIPSAFLSEKEDETHEMSPDELERPTGNESKHPESVHNEKTGQSNNKDTASTEEESIKEKDIHIDDTTTTMLDFNTGGNNMVESQTDVQVPEGSTQIGEEGGNSTRQHRSNSAVKFQRYRKKIVDLWNKCNVSLVHRSYFFLLFKGDPSDNVYLEVELRRLYFLKDTVVRGTNSMIDTQIVSTGSSLKALIREREFLARQLQKKYPKKDREELYKEWGIDLETKQRSLQLTRMLWTDTKDSKHMSESSLLVVKLVGLVEPRYAPKEMFGLTFLTPSSIQKTSSWRDNMSSLL